MGTGPIPASRAALKKAGWRSRITIWSRPTGLCGAGRAGQRDLGWDTSKVNVNGGAIAISHPISVGRASGDAAARMQRRNAEGLATLCIGGMGIAIAWSDSTRAEGAIVSRARPGGMKGAATRRGVKIAMARVAVVTGGTRRPGSVSNL
jgi:hypothetical protein